MSLPKAADFVILFSGEFGSEGSGLVEAVLELESLGPIGLGELVGGVELGGLVGVELGGLVGVELGGLVGVEL